MSTVQLIEGVLNGTVKVADIDPALQWGALGAGLGGAGGLVKSLAAGGSLKDILKQTLGGAALGGGVGLSGAVGAKILGASPPKLTGVLEPKKEYKGDFSSAAGTGILGAGGLLAGAGAEEARDRNEAIRKLIQDPNLKGEELLAKGEAQTTEVSDDLMKHLKEQVLRKGVPAQRFTDAQIAEMLKSKDPQKGLANDLLEEARRHADPSYGSPASHYRFPDKGKGITGKSDMVTKFLEYLQNTASQDASKRNMAEQLLAKMRSPELQAMERFKPTPRATEFLKKFKSPKNLALAAGGIGLGTYGLTGLGERLWGKKD